MAKSKKNEQLSIVDDSVYIAGLENFSNGKSFSNIEPLSGITLKSLSDILKNPQEWSKHKQLLQYCAYYSHYDNMLSGALFNIFIPFSQAAYKLVGGDENTRNEIEEWLKDILFDELLEGMAHDYFVYGRFISYLYDSGLFQILPVFRCKIEDLTVGGNPMVRFEVDRKNSYSKKDIRAYEELYKGYPPEIIKALADGKFDTLLNLDQTFSCSYTKAAWEKYSIPMVTSALPHLIKKDSLSQTEQVELNNMSKSLLEIKVGDKDKVSKPSEAELTKAGMSYVNALKSKGANIACVAWNVESKWLSYSNKDVLENISSELSFCNWNILAALSISPILSAGSEHFNKGTSGSFSQTTAAISAIEKRINKFLQKVSLLMNRVICRYSIMKELEISALPEFKFEKVNLKDDSALLDELLKLYERGLVSNKTIIDSTNLDYETEKKNREKEVENNENEVFKPRPTANQMSSDDAGAPEKDDFSRTTDKENSNRSNTAPKPSTE